MNIQFTAAEVARYNRPVRGQGGFQTLLRMRPVRGQGGWQSLVRRLQRQVSGNVIELTQDDQRRILHYLLSYGTGGWQDRIAGIVGRPRPKGKRSKAGTRRRSTAATT